MIHPMENMITFKTERVDADEVFALLVDSGMFDDVTLPIDSATVGRAFEGSNVVVTARNADARLVGVVRALSDFTRHCFVATVAVHSRFQGQGIGERLLRHAHDAAGGTERMVLFLNAAPGAAGFYEKMGMTHEAHAYSLNNVS
jgi:GNAT superfamily N-acetyltransferase